MSALRYSLTVVGETFEPLAVSVSATVLSEKRFPTLSARKARSARKTGMLMRGCRVATSLTRTVLSTPSRYSDTSSAGSREAYGMPPSER